MKSYYVYLGIPARQEDPWECTATSVGYERVQSGSPYPPRRHPVDHHFDWEKGRVLSAYQLVYITEGQGVFESEVSPKRHRIEAGALMTLFPGAWHRYAPDPQSGWVEQWIECCGPAFDRARDAELLRPERPVWRVGFPPDLLQAFARCHALAQRRLAGAQSLISTMGLHLLSILLRAGRGHPATLLFGRPLRPKQALVRNSTSFRSGYKRPKISWPIPQSRLVKSPRF